MSQALSNRGVGDAARTGFEVWREYAEQLVDKDTWASRCQECGACVADCPAAKFGLGFDPRAIVLKVRYGLADKLLVEHSVVWECFQCKRCHETCPQPVKPAEVIGWLRKMLLDLVHGRQPGGPCLGDASAEDDPQEG